MRSSTTRSQSRRNGRSPRSTSRVLRSLALVANEESSIKSSSLGDTTSMTLSDPALPLRPNEPVDLRNASTSGGVRSRSATVHPVNPMFVPRFSVLALAALGSCGAPERAAIPPAFAIPIPAARATTTPAKGFWLGKLRLSSEELKLQSRIDPDGATPAQTCRMDVLDRNVFGYGCRFSYGPGGAVAIELTPALGWAGVIARAGNTMAGTWTHGSEVSPFAMTREAARIERPKAQMDPALPPVDLSSLGAVLDADVADTLARGELASSTGGGVVIGVVHHGARRVFVYGAVKPDSIFEIGSISKTYTGLLLAQMVQQKKARLDEPIRELLPRGVVAKPATGLEITLLD